MAAILVDYENVCSSNGLKGIEYLRVDDSLYIFYSKCCSRIRAEYIRAIEDNGCRFHIIRLEQIRKNALDFYIAAEAGILSREGEKQIAIISQDKGLLSVADFFRSNGGDSGACVVVASNIELALLSLNAPEDEARRDILHKKTEMLDIMAEHARMQERNILKEKIKGSFAGTEFENISAQICEYVVGNLGKSAKEFYTGTLHTFGRSNGISIYAVVKSLLLKKGEEKEYAV